MKIPKAKREVFYKIAQKHGYIEYQESRTNFLKPPIPALMLVPHLALQANLRIFDLQGLNLDISPKNAGFVTTFYDQFSWQISIAVNLHAQNMFLQVPTIDAV